MDNLTYSYLNIAGAPSNRLGHVDDPIAATNFTDDIDDQSANNYGYDELGQLISDQQELIANIEWRSGDKKIKTLTRAANAGNKSDLEFIYNPLGQRVVKIEKTRLNNVLESEEKWKYTYYAYDANGQVMATYAVKLSSTVNRATLTEQNIYGASRLGMRRKDVRLYENGTSPYTIPDVQQNTLGNIAYEITNYLGNVNVVISDRKLWVASTSAFKACTLSRTDYFPFGMEISSRTAVGNYRYGYNGSDSYRKEQDPEAKGEGNSYTTEFRQYDSRIGRWLSLDPLMAQYPMMSPYVAFNNNPIYFVDPLGLEGDPPMGGDNGRNECDDGKSQTDNNNWNSGEDPYTEVKPPVGHQAERSIGGQEFYLKSDEGIYRSKSTSISKGYFLGEVFSFYYNGSHYKAKWDDGGGFMGYYAGSKYFQPRFSVNGKNYIANSIKTLAGRDGGPDKTGNFKGIHEIDDRHMRTMLAYGTLVYHIWNYKNIEVTTKNESVGGDLDFKDVFFEYYGFSKESLVKYRGIVYNSNEIGNLIWGLVLTANGILINPNTIAEYGTKNRYDEAWEQNAISRGKALISRFSTKNQKKLINYIIPMLREEYQR